jgi:hypothetical protein
MLPKVSYFHRAFRGPSVEEECSGKASQFITPLILRVVATFHCQSEKYLAE